MHSNIRIIAHSLGTRVVLSALESLHNNKEWENKKFKVAFVHFVGAAVDDEEIAKDPMYIVNNASLVNNNDNYTMSQWYDTYGIKSAYGKDIVKEVVRFYNLFNPKDKALQIYKSIEDDNALGLNGAQKGITTPSNYTEQDVQNEILPICDADADGKLDFGLTPADCQNIQRGYNHVGYFGFIDMDTKKLIDSGAMKIVVNDWKNKTS